MGGQPARSMRACADRRPFAGRERRRMANDRDKVLWPRALTPSTQKPFSSSWKVTRSKTGKNLA
jgi:hypothetical protein